MKRYEQIGMEESKRGMEIDNVLFKNLPYPLILTYDLEAYYHAFFVAFIIIFR